MAERYVHSVYSKLHDEDLQLAIDAVRRELRNPSPQSTSVFSLGNRGPLDLVTALGLMQEELDWRIAQAVKGSAGAQGDSDAHR